MKLKSIKLAGFKSFVDPTVIPITKQMSAIVGPNGCGKSNVIDAVRWVIGESSAKQLRGQSMSDVIFNGTSTRQPVGKASVELLFDNTDGRLVGEYAKYAEIAIRREVERDGQSRYFLNNTSCRRRDILDIFLGTGLGPRSYSIIEQGMVSKLVEAKPEELRVYLEEAAGISKYKERRRETGNRIRHTQENLDRLMDLREELDKQQRHLQRQANAAERYKVLKAEERELQAQTKALQWQSLNEKAAEQDDRIRVQSLRRDELETEYQHVETELEKGRVLHDELIETQNSVQKRYYGLGAEIARLEQQIQSTQEQTQRWRTELDEANDMWQEITDNSAEQQTQFEMISAEMAELTPQQSEIQAIMQASHEALQTADMRMNGVQEQWEQFQQQSANYKQQAEVARTTMSHQQRQLDQLQQRLSRLQEQRDQIQLDELASEIMPLAERVQYCETELSAIAARLDDTKQSIQTQRQQNQALKQTLQDCQRALQSSEAKLTSLEALQQAALGSDDQQTQDWLAQRELTALPRLGKQLTVTPGWELAVETILGSHFDAICVNDLNALLPELAELTQGKLTLLQADLALPGDSTATKATTLASQIKTDWPIKEWLNGVYIAEDLAQAQQLRGQLAEHESVITQQGVWLGPNWVRVAKAVDSKDSVLLREQQITELKQQIATQTDNLEDAERELQHGEARLAELEAARETEQQQFQQLTSQFSDAKSQYQVKQNQLNDQKARCARLQSDIDDLQQQQQDAQEALAIAKMQLEEAEMALNQTSQQRELLMTQREECQAALEDARLNAQRDKQRTDELGIRLASNENQISLLKQTLSRAERQLQQLGERRELLSEHLSEQDGPILQLQQQLQTLLDQRLTIENELHAAEDKLEGHNQLLRKYERQRQELQEALNDLQAKLQALQMARQEISVRQTTIQEQLTEENIELDSVLQAMPEAANIHEWEARLEKIAQKIQRLGAINLAAIDECKEVSERKEYIDQQHADLIEALETLQEAIRKIDRETKTKFKDTFDKVNAKFQEVFPRIFGGGRAVLELSDDDLLTAGIMVKAQPPGKRNQTIHMLSGGEKAMTAISLVFSFFSLNPAPICILDEVDAPLDDANVGRYCKIVKEMSQQTQFIVISHNKVTIEAADNLMGVTMQEAGVSRIVSVDMDVAMEMVEA